MRKYAPANNFVLTLLLLIVVTAFHPPSQISLPPAPLNDPESSLECAPEPDCLGFNGQGDFINVLWQN